MDWNWLSDKVLRGECPARAEALAVLHAPADDLLTLLNAAFRVRHATWDRG